MGRLQKQLYELLSGAGAEQAQAAPAGAPAAPSSVAVEFLPSLSVLRPTGRDLLPLESADQHARTPEAAAAHRRRSVLPLSPPACRFERRAPAAGLLRGPIHTHQPRPADRGR